MLRCPDKQSILLQQISEWASQQSKVANELTVLTSKAQEASHLFN
jgi:pyridoxine/pyridoxamine 5'-phosphate oxidase